MSATTLSVHLRVFLSSPGDVADERDRAQRVIESLEKDPFVRSRATLEAVRWDDPDAPTPMPANLPPQEAVNRGLAKPSDCDVVVVILWSRMGTPLDPEIYCRPNGEPYLSGTEWEYEDAINPPTAPDKPIVLVYRRIDEPRIGLSDPDLDQKRKQYDLVENFFTPFRNPDGSLKGGISQYEGPSAFEERFKMDLRSIVQQQLRKVGQRSGLSRSDVTSELAPAAIWRGSPYPGLRAFDESEAPVFFGRGSETDALLRQIRQLETGFCAVIGGSGSGKSSLVRAGLIPRLKANAVPGSKDWAIVTFKPGELGPDPFLPLATELQRVLPPHERASAPADLAGTLAGEPEAISTWGRAALSSDRDWARLLLIVDQFEELFTLATEDRRLKFIELLKHAATDRELLIVATMRADFFAEASRDDRLAQLLRTGTFPLAPLGPAALVEAIRRPAEQAEVEVPSNLVDTILQDVGSGEGALPLVAFCLSELWPQKESAEPRLTLEAYSDLGRLRGAIERRAGQIVGKLGEAERAALPDIFQYLIQVSADGTATRRRVSKVLLEAEPSRARLVKALVDGRLLTSSKDPDAQVEAAHEALFEGWPDLQRWLADNRALLQLRSEIETAMARWRRKGHDPEFLLAGKWLTEAMQFATDRPDLLRPQMLDFIRASETGARALAEHDQAGLRRECLRRAELSRQQTDSGNSRLGILLALEALPENMKDPNRPYVPEAESALYHAIWSSPEAALLPGHKGPISAVEFSPDGQRIVSADENGTVHLWHGASGARIGSLKGHTGRINAAALSLDAKRILTVSEDRTARLWDAIDGRSIACLEGHAGPVIGGAFSPDGHYVLTGSHDHTARLWDGISGAHRVTLQGHTGPITAVAFSLDCHRVVTASQDGTARVWRIGTGTLLAVLKSQLGPITAAIFGCEDRRVITVSSDGVMEFWQVTSGAGPLPDRIQVGPMTAIDFSRNRKFVVTGCADRSALLWDGLTGALVASLEGHTGPVTAASFSHDGARIVTGSSDGALKLWDLRPGHPLSARSTLEGHKEQVTAVALSPDGKRIVAGFKDGVVRLWGTRTGSNLVSLEGHLGPLKVALFSRNALRVATGSQDGTGRLWNHSAQPVQAVSLEHRGPVNHLAFSTNGKRLVTASNDGVVILWEVATGKSIRVVDARGKPLAFNSSGTRLITASREDNTAQLWDVLRGDFLYQFEGHQAPITDASFNSSGTRAITGSEDGIAHVWKTDGRGKIFWTLKVGEGPLLAVTFGADGKRIIVASRSGAVRLWKVTSRGARPVPYKDQPGPIVAVALSPDGRYVLFAFEDSTARLTQLESGTLIATLDGHRGPVTAAAFRLDSTRIVTASHDGTGRLWDTTGHCICVLEGHNGPVYSAAFSADGSRLLTASADGTARVWRVFADTQALIDGARLVAPQQMDAKERERFFLSPF